MGRLLGRNAAVLAVTSKRGTEMEAESDLWISLLPRVIFVCFFASVTASFVASFD